MMNVIGMTNVFPLQNPLDVYYNYKQKREDRRMIQLTAQKEKYAYRNHQMKALKAAQGVQVGPKVGEGLSGNFSPFIRTVLTSELRLTQPRI